MIYNQDETPEVGDTPTPEAPETPEAGEDELQQEQV